VRRLPLGSSGQSCVLCGVARGWKCRCVSGYVMRAPTRTSMTSRVSRHHGTLRHSSCSIVGLPHIDAPLPFATLSLLVWFALSFLFSFFIDSSLWSLVCINFNPGCYHLFFPAVLLYYCYHPQILYNLTALHSFTSFFSLSLLCSFHIQPTLSSFHIYFVSF